MTRSERESLLLTADTIGLVLRRLDENAADALELLHQTVAGWAEGHVRPHEVRRNLGEIYEALRRTPRSAGPGRFARIHDKLAFG
jgi:hypothetical protein